MSKKIAVIDVGSNSVRLMLVADGKVLYKRTQITRLGDGLAFSGRLQEEPMRRTVNQIADFVEEAKEQGANEVYAYATAAVRSAENKEEFLKMVQEDCSILLEVLSGEEEATVGLVGALGQADGALLDIGGGSSELILQRDKKIIAKKSIDVGVVRLKDCCGKDEMALEKYSKEKVKEFYSFKEQIKELTLCAVGGTATTIAAVSLGLNEYDGTKVNGTRLTKEKLKELSKKVGMMSVEEIGSLPCVGEKRAQVLTGGVVWLFALLDYLEKEEFVVSDCDNLEGFAKTRGFL